MKLTDSIIFSLGSSVVLFIQLLTYGNLTQNTLKASLKLIIALIIAGVLVTYNASVNDTMIRAFISFVILLILELLFYKDSITKTLIYGITCYVIAIFIEIIVDIFLIITNFINLQALDQNVIARLIISIIIILPAYYITKNKIMQKRISVINNFLEKSIIFLYVAIITLTASIVIAFKNISNLTYSNYISNIILLISFSAFLIMVIYNEHKVKKEVSKTEALLDFISGYENKIEEDRINKHEMLNNLLILKSYDNKNSKNFNDTLDDLINTYNKKGIDIKNISKLPSGLKGIIYYKVSEIQNKNLNVSINISKQLSSYLSKLDSKTYAVVCKIVGITFDNAIEAAEKSNEKIINFDVYEEKDKIVIEIDNTYKEKIDLSKINHKNYSTKGKGRGLGLYVAHKIVSNVKNVELFQDKENNIFITKIYINKKI